MGISIGIPSAGPWNECGGGTGTLRNRESNTDNSALTILVAARRLSSGGTPNMECRLQRTRSKVLHRPPRQNEQSHPYSGLLVASSTPTRKSGTGFIVYSVRIGMHRSLRI